jgi:hypothetical protein
MVVHFRKGFNVSFASDPRWALSAFMGAILDQTQDFAHSVTSSAAQASMFEVSE